VLLAIALLKISNELLYIGPLDRAAFGWSVPIPLLLLAPAVAGLAARRTGPRAAVAAIAVVAVAIGLALTAALVASVDHIGCEPVDDKLRILAHVAPIGIVAGAGFAIAGLVALNLRAKPVVAVAAAIVAAIAGGVLTLLAFALAFPGVTCVPGSA
jgi:hypothetical protein